MRFWLEWDCGTMNVRDLAVKFTSYASYIATREWAREHSIAACAHVCRAGNRAGEAYATGSPGQARAFTWIRAVDNYTVAVE